MSVLYAWGGAVLLGLVWPLTAQAHSFGKPFMLPLPFELYAGGAVAAFAVSLLCLVWMQWHGRRATQTPHTLQRAAHRAGRNPCALRLPHWLSTALSALSCAFLLLAVVSGFAGSQSVHNNINMTWFWVGVWLGMQVLSVCVGGVWRLCNPWAPLLTLWARWTAGARRPAIPSDVSHSKGPWPAVVLFYLFVFLELFVHPTPSDLSWALVLYTVCALTVVARQGLHVWYARWDFLSGVFEWLSCLARVQLRPTPAGWVVDCGAQARLDAQGEAARIGNAHAVFVCLMVASTAFDGVRNAMPWSNALWKSLMRVCEGRLSENPILAIEQLRPLYLGAEALLLLGMPFALWGLLRCSVAALRAVRSHPEGSAWAALRIAPALLPIAWGYTMAHYFTLLFNQGVQTVHFLSDPLGLGWNVFGTAGWWRAPLLFEPATLWHLQWALIVGGHAVSAVMAHDALNRMGRAAGVPVRLYEHLPFLCLMLAMTVGALWMLSQPIRPMV